MTLIVRAEVFPRDTGGYEGVLTAIRGNNGTFATLHVCGGKTAYAVQVKLDSKAREVLELLNRPTVVSVWTKEWEVAERT